MNNIVSKITIAIILMLQLSCNNLKQDVPSTEVDDDMKYTLNIFYKNESISLEDEKIIISILEELPNLSDDYLVNLILPESNIEKSKSDIYIKLTFNNGKKLLTNQGEELVNSISIVTHNKSLYAIVQLDGSTSTYLINQDLNKEILSVISSD